MLRRQRKLIRLMTAQELAREVKFNEAGLVPAIVQDAHSQQVLMLGWMNAESLQSTLALGEVVFWSRSRQEIWHKGATSGNTQKVIDISIDCDDDALLIRVEPAGPICHTGAVSCFFRTHSNSFTTATD